MVPNPNIVRNVVITFAIGFIAAISPFLFMQLLPALLNPSLNLDAPNYWAILLTGILVGGIISIIFATQFEKREPQDIFFYALGIPAILIATVSNISTEFKAVRQVSEVRESLTSAVLSPPKPEILKEMPKPVAPPQPLKQGWNSGGNAWAQERQDSRPVLLAQALNYFVASENTAMRREPGRIIENGRIKGFARSSIFPKTWGFLKSARGNMPWSTRATLPWRRPTRSSSC